MNAFTLDPHTGIRRRGASLAAILIIILIIAGAIYYYRTHVAGASRTRGSSGSSSQEAAPDLKPLQGKWLRPDSGLILEILSVEKEGPISVWASGPGGTSVSGADARVVDGLLEVSVDFSDPSCSGCTMRLTYDENGDRLIGSYTENNGARRDVLFTRTRD
jgi:hypothetical protein